jgi:hypothetical protein
MPNLVQRWLPFAATTGLALAVWGLAAAHGYGWAMIWLPAVVAGAAWPRQSKAQARPTPDGAGGRPETGRLSPPRSTQARALRSICRPCARATNATRRL